MASSEVSSTGDSFVSICPAGLDSLVNDQSVAVQRSFPMPNGDQMLVVADSCEVAGPCALIPMALSGQMQRADVATLDGYAHVLPTARAEYPEPDADDIGEEEDVRTLEEALNVTASSETLCSRRCGRCGLVVSAMSLGPETKEEE